MSVPFYRPFFPERSRREVLDGIERILTSGRLMLGEFTEKLESGFGSHHARDFAVSTSTCTSALQMCLMHYDVRGREVLVPSAAFITDISVIRWAGGIPVLVDIDPRTLAFDLDDLRRKVTPRTKGMIWVHLVGLISPAWREIVDFARQHDLFLLEDCAHAHGASVDGVKAGAIGDAGCFSFYPTKVMTSGTGGIAVTNDPALANSLREMRLFGHGAGDRSNRVIREGSDWFLDEIRACVAYSQLCDLESFLGRRRAIAAAYRSRLVGLPGVRLLDVPEGNLPAWYHFPLFLDEHVDYAAVRDKLAAEHGIATKQIYIPLHHESIFRDLDDGSLRNTEEALSRSLCLPLFVEMTEEQVEYVARSVRAVTSEAESRRTPAVV